MAGVNGVPQQLNTMQDRFNFLRTGAVILVDPFYVTVRFTVAANTGTETTDIRAAYVRQSEPVVGDLVAVMRQGASWFVAGTTSTTGGNLVENPSFEEFGDSLTPTDWTLYAVSGVPAFRSIEAPELAVDGDRVLEVVGAPGAATTALAYSRAIAVGDGQVWEISAYADGHYPGDNPNTLDVNLYALWFANATDAYPTTSNADTLADSAVNIAETELMQIQRGTVTVPAGASFMRVGLRSAVSAYTAARWDFATARRIS